LLVILRDLSYVDEVKFVDLPLSVFVTEHGYSIITHGPDGKPSGTLGTESILSAFVEGRIEGCGELAVTPDIHAALQRLKDKGDSVDWNWEQIANSE